jgi:DNA invertase Pin-like site-specific DNA recombinase
MLGLFSFVLDTPLRFLYYSSIETKHRKNEMAVYSYLRVSTSEQDVQLQIDAIKQRGYAVEDANVFVDHGVSGSKPAFERLAFRTLLGELRAGDIVLCYAVDRLGRNTSDVLVTVEKLTEMGVSIVFIRDGIDTAGAVGKLMLTVLAAVACFEKDTLVKRVKDGMATEAAKANLLARPASETKRANIMAIKEIVERFKESGIKPTIDNIHLELLSLGLEIGRATVATLKKEIDCA